jgi:dolichol kinase
MLGYEPRDVAPPLVYIFIPAFFGDVVRFIWPAFNRLWMRVMGPLMRDKEKQQWNGVIFYLLGAWIVLSFFPKVPSLRLRYITYSLGHRNRFYSPIIMVRYRSINIRSSLW